MIPLDPLFLILFGVGYALGSIPFGLILTKIITKQDIRTIGSGNIGATNVLRTGNKKLALATLLLDVAKAALPIGYIHYAAPFAPPSEDPIGSVYLLSSVVGVGAILGHCFPIWLKFKGGKGVATGLGVLLTAVPYAGLAACLTWIICAKTTKYSSLSALMAFLIAPVVTFFTYSAAAASICALITALIWFRHKDNIKRLISGNEPKIGENKKKEGST